MSYLQALLAADSRRHGRALRSATMLHRYVAPKPLAIVLWQLGAEPFTAAAVAWGSAQDKRKLVVPGEPRDRELAFRALLQVAKDFNAWFEGASRDPDQPPQVVVSNAGNLTLLRRLGRRLAYLPLDGDRPADPALVRFGRHLQFVTEHARVPGQQLVIVLTDLLSSHWVSELSELEAQSLPALDAMIEPPKGMTGHQAAFKAEQIQIGPAPDDQDDDAVEPFLTAFNAKRNRATDESVVAPLRVPIEKHYERLVDRSWGLIWRCLERERRWPPAPSVERRLEEDVAKLDRHLEWILEKGGRYRTRQTNASAARTLRGWEEATRLLKAEEAIDDPLKMIPFMLTNEAVAGKIVDIDLEHREEVNGRNLLRPHLIVESAIECNVPAGTELYWTKLPKGAPYIVLGVRKQAGKWRVLLQHENQLRNVARPEPGHDVIFSIHTIERDPPLLLPSEPWTHQQEVESIEAAPSHDVEIE